MKKLVRLFLCAAMIVSLATLTTSSVKAASGSMKVTVLSDSIKIYLNGIDTSGTVYGYRANSYADGDDYNGISKLDSEDFSAGEYDADDGNQVLTVDRYDENGYDRLYDKFYLISSDDDIIKGPVYATSIPSANKNVKFTQKSKKGLFNENKTNVKYAKDLGVSSITVNLDLGNFVYMGNHPDDAVEYKSNGQTYYFNKSVIDYDDSIIIPASKQHMNVIAVVAPWSGCGYNTFPSSIRYSNSAQKGTMGINTSTKEGMNQYIAMMEFLADRYSKNADTGLISTYVIGNEVDFTPAYFNSTNLDEFMSEYERTLRLSNMVVKKYASNANVAISLTHYWNGDAKNLGKESKRSLRPYKMLNWLAKATAQQGAYDWAIAPHCYASVATTSRMIYTDSKMNWTYGSYKTAKQITFTNLEVLQAYLSQSKLKYKGKIRSVYLTESGVSSSKKSKKAYRYQVQSLAASYIKVANLSCIKSYNYYRLIDNKAEAKYHLTCGLLTSTKKKKPAYYAYKYADTLKFTSYANKYIASCAFLKNGNKNLRYSFGNGKIQSYFDTMYVYNNGYKVGYSTRNCLKKSLKKYDSGLPHSLKTTRKYKNSISISWTKSKASGYRILVNGKVKGSTTKSYYRITGLKRWTKYNVSVQAYKKVNGKKYYGQASVLKTSTR